MILEVAAAIFIGLAGPQSVGAEISDLQRRIRTLRAEADQTPQEGPIVLRTPAEFQASARRALVDTLREPGSALFRNVRQSAAPNGGMVFCGEVNSRNGFGGMTGFVRFQASASPDGRTYAEIDEGSGAAGAYFNMGWNRDCASGRGSPVTF